MYRLKTIHLSVFSALCFFILLHCGIAVGQSEQAKPEFVLREVSSQVENGTFVITMAGDSTPTYTSRELYDPYRLVVDIADVTLADNLSLEGLLPQNDYVTLQTAIVRGVDPEITRFIFTAKEGYTQEVQRQENALVVKIMPAQADATAEGGASQDKVDAKAVATADKNEQSASGEKIRELIQSSITAADPDKREAAAQEIANNFDFAGYKRERISIDFYKMDLHNVFRLFRQVSGLNLIVDEGVSGSLTLALNDVPWDFALDIILNLADLEKEEKFNTIIVYPKDKEFDWPKRAADNLSFEANLEVVQQEALIIEQSANQPKEIMQAKEIMRQAVAKEKNNEYEEAVNLYEQAAELWPANSNLTSKLAALYLVRLGMNAKGIHYAQKSLEADPDNYKAALYAAIGMANMNRIPEAVELFSRSISGNPPMKEALASYAAFSESTGRYPAALKLYEKYHEYYGETVNTMVAKARIYDRMGKRGEASEQYRAVLASGFPLQVGLKDYIQARISDTN